MSTRSSERGPWVEPPTAGAKKTRGIAEVEQRRLAHGDDINQPQEAVMFVIAHHQVKDPDYFFADIPSVAKNAPPGVHPGCSARAVTRALRCASGRPSPSRPSGPASTRPRARRPTTPTSRSTRLRDRPAHAGCHNLTRAGLRALHVLQPVVRRSGLPSAVRRSHRDRRFEAGRKPTLRPRRRRFVGC